MSASSDAFFSIAGFCFGHSVISFLANAAEHDMLKNEPKTNEE